MNINTFTCSKLLCRKQAFRMRARSSKAPLLKVHHTTLAGNAAKQSVRFLHASFNTSGDQLALYNHIGNIYILQFSICKYWLVAHVNCSTLKFTTCDKYKELLVVATSSGNVHVFNCNTSRLIADMHGHKYPVCDISFSNRQFAVTISSVEAIIWNMENYTKVQLLQLDEGIALKMIMFIPECEKIMACFQDESIQVWCGEEDFKAVEQIVPRSVNGAFARLTIRSIEFSGNGKEMLVVGSSPTIFVFDVDTLKLQKEVTLNDAQIQLKKVVFMSLYDAIALLTTSGILLFFDLHREVLINKFTLDDEIWKFAWDPNGGKIAVICRNGDVCLYPSSLLVNPVTRKKTTVTVKKSIRSESSAEELQRKTPTIVQDQMNEILDMSKLKSILREFGEYPAMYRQIIWTHILHLPNDAQQYELVSKTEYEHNFAELEKCYPLGVKTDLKNLKRLLANLVSWCPFLSVVNYLPSLVFPFVKYLQADPVLCFECIISLIVNYCQHWFEYHPIPPLNILGIVESILFQQDYELFQHFDNQHVSSNMYAWYLFQSMFSEVLTSDDWFIFCDHLFSNDPAFLIVAAAAFAITHRTTLLGLEHEDDFECFFRTNSPFDMKRFLERCYKLLNDQSLENHPSLYLLPYQPFENGKYPIFDQFPKNCLEVCESIKDLRIEGNVLRQEERAVRERNEELEKLQQHQRKSVEYLRQVELERLYTEKLKEESQKVANHRERLKILHQEVREKEQRILHRGPSPIRSETSEMSSIQHGKKTNLQESLLQHYTNLLKHRIHIEESVDDENMKKTYKQLTMEMRNGMLPSDEDLKQLNVSAGLAAVNCLIDKVEKEISSQSTKSQDKLSTKQMVAKLKFKYEELNKDLSGLINILCDSN